MLCSYSVFFFKMKLRFQKFKIESLVSSVMQLRAGQVDSSIHQYKYQCTSTTNIYIDIHNIYKVYITQINFLTLIQIEYNLKNIIQT